MFAFFFYCSLFTLFPISPVARCNSLMAWMSYEKKQLLIKLKENTNQNQLLMMFHLKINMNLNAVTSTLYKIIPGVSEKLILFCNLTWPVFVQRISNFNSTYRKNSKFYVWWSFFFRHTSVIHRKENAFKH